MGVETWFAKDEVVRRVSKATVARNQKCGLLVEAEAKQLLRIGALSDGPSPYLGQKSSVIGAPPGHPPFLRSDNLRASITAAPTDEGTCVVGPTHTAWYGRVLEWGAVINVTPKMRAFLGWAFGWHLSKSKTAIHIEARPFMAPALDNCIKKFPDVFKDLPLGGDIQKP